MNSRNIPQKSVKNAARSTSTPRCLRKNSPPIGWLVRDPQERTACNPYSTENGNCNGRNKNASSTITHSNFLSNKLTQMWFFFHSQKKSSQSPSPNLYLCPSFSSSTCRSQKGEVDRPIPRDSTPRLPNIALRDHDHSTNLRLQEEFHHHR